MGGDKPGFLEADTIAHCGETLLGQFAYTIDTVDIATGWTEQRAVWGKGETESSDNPGYRRLPAFPFAWV